jgi:hypothetical protein
VPGDCWRTVIACLLELPRDDVPHFLADEDDPDGIGWWVDSVAFVEAHTDHCTLVALEPVFPVYLDPDMAPACVIGISPSPRAAVMHAVIVDARTGELVWDVHLSRAGLAGPLVEISAIVGRA